MSFQEDLSEFLDVEHGFASKALIITAAGSEHRVKGILTADYIDIDSGMVGIAGCRPCFECAEKDVTGVGYDDLLTVNDKNYRVRGLKPDGTGWIVLILEEQE